MLCEDKRKMTEAVATEVIERARIHPKKALRRVLFKYVCPTCGFWHMTSSPPRPTQHWTRAYGLTR